MPVNIFISYTHEDNLFRKEICKRFAQFERNGQIEFFYDGKIPAGSPLFINIDSMMNKADIFFLLLSSTYLASDACIKEIKRSEELSKEKGISVIPIILKPCAWHDNDFIHSLKAIPKDGRPISDFDNEDCAYMDIYNNVKPLIEEKKKIENLSISEGFRTFLLDVDFLSKAHSKKDKVILEDIFVYPKLRLYNDFADSKKNEKNIVDGENVKSTFLKGGKIILAGAGQSGKTTLLKRTFLDLVETKFIPIYIFDKEKKFQGPFKKRIESAFHNEYFTDLDVNSLNKSKIVLLVDDFHNAKEQESIIDECSDYPNLIFSVDDIFSIDLKDSSRVSEFLRYTIQEYSPSQRDTLIRKWLQLSNQQDSIADYKEIDEETELVDAVLGKAIGKGVMPSYPFFILSIVSTYEASTKPIDNEISSQGYCYQALLIFFLTKQKVSSDDIDSYLNFLSQFAYYLYKEKKHEVTEDEFEDFFKKYCDEYTFCFEKNVFLRNLVSAQILKKSLGFYSFSYLYLYYFFAGKFFAEESDSDFKDAVENIANNLHTDENAYIAIFIAHHTKKGYLLEKLKNVCNGLFNKNNPATLEKKGLDFFDKQIKNIFQPNMDPGKCEDHRHQQLETKDAIEESNSNSKFDDDNDFSLNLRQAIKAVEVVGQIIKNRAGSLKKAQLEDLYTMAMDVHLRIMDFFLNIIRDDKNQEFIISMIDKRLNELSQKKTMSDIERSQMAKKIFWNINFFTILGMLEKIRASLGSSKLKSIIESIAFKNHTPAVQIIKQINFMWYNKVVDVNAMKTLMDDEDFSQIAKNTLRFAIANYVSLHRVNYKDASQIRSMIDVPQRAIQRGLISKA